MHSCFYFIIDYGTNTVKVFIYIQITESNNFQPVSFYYFCSDFIFFLLVQLIMTTAIQFYYKSGLEAVKVGNIMINALLALKSDRVAFQKAVPEFSFPRGHILAELFGTRFIFFVVFHNSPRPFGAPPS